jgi:hypothetical protein
MLKGTLFRMPKTFFQRKPVEDEMMRWNWNDILTRKVKCGFSIQAGKIRVKEIFPVHVKLLLSKESTRDLENIIYCLFITDG